MQHLSKQYQHGTVPNTSIQTNKAFLVLASGFGSKYSKNKPKGENMFSDDPGGRGSMKTDQKRENYLYGICAQN